MAGAAPENDVNDHRPSHNAIAQVLEQHAAERKLWASWGQTLRAESTSLEGGAHSDLSFTREFLRSSALQNMFESVFVSPMEHEDKNNLLFIMKICLLNSRAAASSRARGASIDDSTAPKNRDMDFIEQVCARLVKLGEEFLKAASARQEWFDHRCSQDGSADGTPEDDALSNRVESDLATMQEHAREAVAAALCSIKLRHHELLDIDERLSTSLVDALGGLGSSPGQLDATKLSSTGGSSHHGAGLATYVSALHEPRCSDVFDSTRAPGVFQQARAAWMPGDNRDMNTVTTATSTTTSSIGGAAQFASTLPAMEPNHLAEHDAWASHMHARAIRKIREVSRELASYIAHHEFDEEVRYCIEEQLNLVSAMLPPLAAHYQQVDAYAAALEEARKGVQQDREAACAAAEARIQEQLQAQEALRERLAQLEEEARAVRANIGASAKLVVAQRQELHNIDTRFSSLTRTLDRRSQDIVIARDVVRSHTQSTKLAQLFLQGLARRSAEQTTLHLKDQEAIIAQQCQFAVAHTEDAVRRLGVVASMLDTSRNHMRAYCAEKANASIGGGSSCNGAGVVGASSDGVEVMRPVVAADVALSPVPPTLLKQLSSSSDDVARVLQDRVECCRDVVKCIETLFEQLTDCGFEATADVLSNIRVMWDAVDFHACQWVLQASNNATFPPAGSAMASRTQSSFELCDAVPPATAAASCGGVPTAGGYDGTPSSTPPPDLSTPSVGAPTPSEGVGIGGGSTTSVHKCGLPHSVRKRTHPKHHRRGHDAHPGGSDHLLHSGSDGVVGGAVGWGIDTADLPTPLKRAVAEVEKLHQRYAMLRCHTVE